MAAMGIQWMVSPELAFTVLVAAITAAGSIGGVWIAGLRRGDKADARILALEKDASRVNKLWNWMLREQGRSERSDVRELPRNPKDTP